MHRCSGQRGHNLGSWGLTSPVSAGALPAILEGWAQSLNLSRTGGRFGAVAILPCVLQMGFHSRTGRDDTSYGPTQLSNLSVIVE